MASVDGVPGASKMASGVGVPGASKMASGDNVPGGLPVDKINGLEVANHTKHHTTDFETDALIIRRGQNFSISIELKREFHKEKDKFHIILETGERPKKSSRTLIQIESVYKFTKNEWGYKIMKSSDKKLINIDVSVPSDCIVSKYRLSVETIYKDKSKRKTVSYDYNKAVYILFNAWCEDDEVYMKDFDLRDEYVLNDTGAVFIAGRRPKYWNFAQFSDPVFRCAFSLLEKTRADWRDTAREVSRVMSAMANDADDDGVLSGNWSGDYEGGRKPWEWQGSLLILKQYLETGEPVKFGQCWVFSGVITSLLRALGVPTRSVTNYDSAHDTDNNLTFDKYFDEDGEYLELSDDSCWNFHVWNECWMSRPDLPVGYGGWQAIDSTPQETSKGKYRTGPASILAIKEGKVNLNYDTKFIFAEVNADKVYWQRNKDTKIFEPIRVEPNQVGHHISTKAVGSGVFYFDREDLTLDYKYAEGSSCERISVKRALKSVRNPVIKERPKDVKFSVDAPDELLIGKNVVLSILLHNTADKSLNVDASVTAHIVRYNGVVLKKITRQQQKVEVSRKSKSSLKFTFDRSEYVSYLDEKPMIRLSIMARVQETKQIYVTQKVVSIEKPDLTVTISAKPDTRVKPGEMIRVKVTLQLPENINKLTGCVLRFEGSALDGSLEYSVPDGRGSGTYSVEKSIAVRKLFNGRKMLQLLVNMSSKEMSGLQGVLVLECIHEKHDKDKNAD